MMISGRQDTYRERDPLAKRIEDHFKNRDAWDKVDSGRMGGGDWYDGGESPYDYMSDQQLIEKYLEEKRSEAYWENDRR